MINFEGENLTVRTCDLTPEQRKLVRKWRRQEAFIAVTLLLSLVGGFLGYIPLLRN